MRVPRLPFAEGTTRPLFLLTESLHSLSGDGASSLFVWLRSFVLNELLPIQIVRAF